MSPTSFKKHILEGIFLLEFHGNDLKTSNLKQKKYNSSYFKRAEFMFKQKEFRDYNKDSTIGKRQIDHNFLQSISVNSFQNNFAADKHLMLEYQIFIEQYCSEIKFELPENFAQNAATATTSPQSDQEKYKFDVECKRMRSFEQIGSLLDWISRFDTKETEKLRKVIINSNPFAKYDESDNVSLDCVRKSREFLFNSEFVIDFDIKSLKNMKKFDQFMQKTAKKKKTINKNANDEFDDTNNIDNVSITKTIIERKYENGINDPHEHIYGALSFPIQSNFVQKNEKYLPVLEFIFENFESDLRNSNVSNFITKLLFGSMMPTTPAPTTIITTPTIINQNHETPINTKSILKKRSFAQLENNDNNINNNKNDDENKSESETNSSSENESENESENCNNDDDDNRSNDDESSNDEKKQPQLEHKTNFNSTENLKVDDDNDCDDFEDFFSTSSTQKQKKIKIIEK